MHPRAKAVRRRPPTRQLILSAASRVFARDGLEGATTRAISREAGVNEVTLFRHFGTKERLLEAVVGSAFGPGGEAAAAPGRGGRNLRADLVLFARRYEALLVANLPLIRTMIGEIHRHALCQRQALKGIFWPMRAALVERLRLARRTGEARPGLHPAVRSCYRWANAPQFICRPGSDGNWRVHLRWNRLHANCRDRGRRYLRQPPPDRNSV